MPIEGVVLQMKSMHIDSVINFPFPTPPDRLTLMKAETLLAHLGALSSPMSVETMAPVATTGQITELGKSMSLFPLSPRFSRMLVSGRQQGCLPYIIAVVSALSVGDPFLREENLDNDNFEVTEEAEPDRLLPASFKAKEAKSALRRAFFQSQQVSTVSVTVFLY
jgi:ATP-dependent RNA helicase DHX37/DHR1